MMRANVMNVSASAAARRKSTEPVFLTAADARRMEAAEEHGALYHAKNMTTAHGAWEAYGSGHLVFIARNYPIGRAHALGFAGTVTPEDIRHVEEFYFQRGSAAQVDVCPYADPSLFASLNERGFQVLEFNTTLARWILPEERFGARLKKIEIRGIRKEEVEEWSRVLARTFFANQWRKWEHLFLPWAKPESPLTLAAVVDGRIVGTASGVVVPEYKLAAFFGAATLPEFRGCGIQSAFMQERLRIARDAGCDLAVTLTMPGTTSQRNAERAGFRVAYTKVVCSKPCPQ